MLALLISIGISITFIIAGMKAGYGTAALVFNGVAGLVLPQLLIVALLRKKSKKLADDLQGIMLAGQKRMNIKVSQLQQKAGGNVKLMQRQLEKGQHEVFQKALGFTAEFEPLKKWNLMMGRQIATMRLQFLYQLKEFDKVDELLAKGLLRGPIMMEPLTVAMKMARQFKNNDIAGAEKTFNWHIKFFRGNRGTLLYGLMSWIYMKQGESEKARQLLLKGKEATANETLAKNWELLSNAKDKQFSNKGLGDEWYGLYLEAPPAPKTQRMRPPKGGRRF
ncbi:hypothetical protein ACFLQY_03750 [Verrucomicrobiota bacterium]